MSFPGKLIKGLFRRLWLQYFVRDFNIGSVFFVGGMILFLFGAIFGLVHWIHSALAHQVTPTGTVMLAVLPIVLGVQLLLQVIVLDVQNVPNKPIFNGYDIE